jgi:hypothetical protein
MGFSACGASVAVKNIRPEKGIAAMTETKSKKSKWKYWVGDLIDGREPAYDPRPLDENSCRIGPAPPPPLPQPKMGNSMSVGSNNFWGICTKDLKVVEWYAACCKARGIAVYFEEEYKDKEDGEYYWKGREDQDGDTCPIYHNGKFIGFLYDAADEDLANRELAYRDQFRADELARIEINNAAREKQRAAMKLRCIANGCGNKKSGAQCPHSEKSSTCAETDRYFADLKRRCNAGGCLHKGIHNGAPCSHPDRDEHGGCVEIARDLAPYKESEPWY